MRPGRAVDSGESDSEGAGDDSPSPSFFVSMGNKGLAKTCFVPMANKIVICTIWGNFALIL